MNTIGLIDQEIEDAEREVRRWQGKLAQLRMKRAAYAEVERRTPSALCSKQHINPETKS